MKVLIAVITCHAYRPRADAQRSTWIHEVAGADVRFFLGRQPGYVPHSDEVLLDVEDTYMALISKVKAMHRWALEHGYDYVFKCDDDVYVRPERLLASGFAGHDYVGRKRGPAGQFRAPYASGLGYWLSARALAVLAKAEPLNHRAEDCWVGNLLCDAGISCDADYRYAVVTSPRNAVSAWEGPRQGNDLIAVGEFEPALMTRIHQEWRSKPATVQPALPAGPLSEVSILITTFLRDGYLERSIEGARRALPECKLVIVDDGYESQKKITLYAKLRRAGHACSWLPFDSGLSAKRNSGVEACATKYLLLGCDDFDFSTREARQGIEKLVAALEAAPELDVVSGRVNGYAYEGFLDYQPGKFIRQDWLRTRPARVAGAAILCDLTVNYFLMRVASVRDIAWDERMKIGGEHGDWFLSLKEAGRVVGWVPDVNITTLKLGDGVQVQHPAYRSYRERAKGLGHPIFLQKRNVPHMIGFNGELL